MHVKNTTPIKQDLIEKNKIFKPNSWIASINFINHLVLFNNVLMAVLAEPGNGKTTFADLIKLGIDVNIDCFSIKSKPNFKIADLLKQLSSFTAFIRGETLEIFTSRVNANKKPTLIIIDDAHYLDDSCLMTILHGIKNYPDSNFFHVCLVADNSLLIKLKELDDKYFHDKIHSVKLGNLTETETKNYLLTRFSDNPKLKKINEKELEKFYSLTQGNIAQINEQLPFFFNHHASSFTNLKLKYSSLVASSLLVLIGASYFWHNSSTPTHLNFLSELSSANEAITQVVKQVQLESKIPALAVAAVKEPLQPPPLNKVFAINEDNDITNMVVMDKVVTIPKSLQKHLVCADPALPSDIISINALIKKQEEIKQKKSYIHEEDLKSDEDIIAEDSNQERENLSQQKYLDPYMLGSASNHGAFTIQLMASINEHDLKRFSKRWGISEQVKMVKINRDGIGWYVLTLGSYEKKQYADQVLSKLPENLVKFKPWVSNIKIVNATG